MRVRDNEFPVVIQAYDTRDKQDLFVAEQVVNTQVEVDTFTLRYAGKLIKVRMPTGEELRHDNLHGAVPRKRSSGAGTAILLILLVLAALLVAGFTTGWIQNNLGWNLNF